MDINGIRIADTALLHVLAGLEPGTPVVFVSDNATWAPAPALRWHESLESLATALARAVRISEEVPILGWLEEPMDDHAYESAFTVMSIAAHSVNGRLRTVLLTAQEMNRALPEEALVIQAPGTGSAWTFALVTR
ncbi:hypothetical protein ATY41_07055 [Leifsonia xyli subsp. xyli]|nr:hypothetical protein [Leifsonia xyli]ODA90984.1 hypothetical protein ATY41_07055 [Leifsonia xyli subsp. xyli]